MTDTLRMENSYFDIILRFILFAVFLQAAELAFQKKLFGKVGLFANKMGTGFYILLACHVVSIIWLFVFGFHWPIIIPFFFLIYLNHQFGGPLNGGADYMTALVIVACVLHLVFIDSELAGKIILFYLSLQVVLSYFIAGLVKLKSAEWRDGTALKLFLLESNYNVPVSAKMVIESPGLSKAASWGILFFECSFPIVFINEKVAFTYLGYAVLFHLANFYLLGLNRFFWVWISAYPALIWSVQFLAN